MTTNQKHNSLIDAELTGNNPFLIGKKMYKSPTCNVMHFENNGECNNSNSNKLFF